MAYTLSNNIFYYAEVEYLDISRKEWIWYMKGDDKNSDISLKIEIESLKGFKTKDEANNDLKDFIASNNLTNVNILSD